MWYNLKNSFRLVGILFFVFVILTSCRKASKNQSLNVVNINLGRSISTLDPATSYDTVSATVLYNSYETLYQYHYLKRPYTIIPLLAEGMPKIEDHGKKYTIKIQKNIRYHSNPAFDNQTRFLKASDFINQIKRLAFKGTQSNGWFLFDGKVIGLNNFREEAGTDLNKFFQIDVEGLQAPDDHTLVIKLLQPYPQLIYALAMTFTSPLPKEAILHYNNNFNNVIIGTGPYYLIDWNPELFVDMKRFENFHEEFYPSQGDRYSNDNDLLKDAGKKLPFIDGIKFHVIQEDNPRWLNFLSSKIDILIVPKDNFNAAINTNGDISDELKAKNIKLQKSPTLTYWWLGFNMKDPVIGKNLNLRKAIAHAIDIDRFIELFTNNTGQRAYSIYPSGIPGYSPENKLKNEYNLEKAKEFLKLAGFPDGKGLPVIKFDERGNTATSRQRAEFIKNELEKIGVRIDINLNTFPGFLKKARLGDLQFWLDGWALDYPDAENVLQLLYSKNHPPGPNSTSFSDKEFDQLFNKLSLMENTEEKFNLMIKMESIVHEQLPWVMLYYDRRYNLHHGYLKNFRYSDVSSNYVKYLRLEKN